MSERDLVRELKENIKELTKDRDDALDKVKTKESRMRQVMIKLEHATDDVQSMGHKIGEQNKKMADLEAKLETKARLLEEALERIKSLTDDSTQETESHTDDKEVD
jgi:chromosome segregation ATPase